ncbi:hypothetical protein BamIOP4010DRAFT_1489 [Burkholderia ambifaria IOP40-10]|uniref:Uncharacterized protein n=1 Tax=Burkholderia ambifaria IOP40-10 TaxID=396596 RepID=B1FBT0_9BURK|nr:hypothetical protein BamIOP4010DRAFT_1489 [Burkholderia ambifaria IOP40-10]
MTCGDGCQRGRRACGQHKRWQRRIDRRTRLRGRRRRRRFGDDDMCIRATEAERVDADRQRCVAALERREPIDHAQAAAFEIDAGIGRVEMQRARHRAVLQAQHGLQQAGNARCRFEVPDIGLDRADQQRIGLGPAARYRVDQRTRLDRIADRGARAMRLEIGERARVDAGASIDGAQQVGLRRRRRHVDAAVRMTIRIHARSGDDRVDRVAIGQRLVKRLEQHECAAFGPHVAVAGRIERAATAARRQHRRLRETDETERMQQQIDSAGKRHRGLAGLQRADRLMERDERRRACSIDRQARAAQVEQVGHTVRRDAERVAGCRIRIDRVHVVHIAVAVIHARHADEHAAVASAHRRRTHAGVFERLPCEFEQQPLLRIHLRRLARRDAEEFGVEARDVVDDARRERVALSRLPFGRMLVERRTETVRRNGGHGITFVAQQLPEVVGTLDATGEPTRHPDDRYLLVHALSDLASALRSHARGSFEWVTADSSIRPSSSARISCAQALALASFFQTK